MLVVNLALALLLIIVLNVLKGIIKTQVYAVNVTIPVKNVKLSITNVHLVTKVLFILN